MFSRTILSRVCLLALPLLQGHSILTNTVQAARPAALASLRPVSAPLRPAPFLLSLAAQRRLLSDAVRQAIDKAVGSAPVVLFMKGTPETPQCGFSRASIQVLGIQGVDPEKFAAYNVLEDAELREGTIFFLTFRDLGRIADLRRHQGVLGLADHPAALRRQGVCRRLRHHRVDAPERRAGQDARGQGRAGDRG